MFLGSTASTSSKVRVARSRKPALRKSAPSAASAVGALRAREVAAGEQPLVHLDRALHLAGLAQQVAQHLQHLDRVGILARDLGQLADRQLELAGGQVVQAQV